MTTSWSVERDQAWLLERLRAHLNPGGSAYFSTNCHGFALTDQLPAFSFVEELTKQLLPEDFTSRAPHRCWRMVR